MVRDNSNEKALVLEGESKSSVDSGHPKSVLEAFERIVELAKGANFSDAFFKQAAECISHASGILELSEMQTVLLALFINKCGDKEILLSDIAEYVGCSTTKMVRVSTDVDVLERKFYLRADRGRYSISYKVPYDVLEALKCNLPYVRRKVPIENIRMFFMQLKILMDGLEQGTLVRDEVIEETRGGLVDIKTTGFSKSLAACNLTDEELLVFLYIANAFVDKEEEPIELLRLMMSFSIVGNFKIDGDLILSHCEKLIGCNLLERVNVDGNEEKDVFRLTDHVKTNLQLELAPPAPPSVPSEPEPKDEHPVKKLFYNEQEKKHIEELSVLLSEDKFSEVTERLHSIGRNKGFCCLFYGAPGTGKTETVYQIARATGRRVMRVDLSGIRSCWVGTSEENVKEIFVNYAKLCSEEATVPILLFNEADGILGVRLKNPESAVEQMENTLQNIILQEMEDLEGIMIATTNLTANLDSAFERRFLYKINFCKPTVAVRAQIWRAMLPGLSEKDAQLLAERFDFSGGEIENVVRKYVIKSVLLGLDTVDISTLEELCRAERIADLSETKIGFTQPAGTH